MNRPTLFIFSGLPGVGKSSLAKALTERTGAVYLRIDTVEQAIRDLCDFRVEGEGYRLSYRLASDNLKLGNNVIADSCNPIALTREEWNAVALNSNANFINIEVICSAEYEHQKRVKTRASEIPGLVLPTWEQVQKREYHPWASDRVVIDTSLGLSNSIEKLIYDLAERGYINMGR